MKILETVGKKIRFEHNGFVFSCDKYTYPPKNILIKQAEDKSGYFLYLAREKYGDKYTYSEYQSCSFKIGIECNTCGNRFSLKPTDHLSKSGRGCKVCSLREAAGKQRLPFNEFLERAYTKWGEIYDYSKSFYINIDTDITIKCNDCGNTFKQTPYNHLIAKKPCSICRGKEQSKLRTKDTDTFVNEAKAKWGDAFNYSFVDYKGSHIKVKIKCNKCYSILEQTPTNHLSDKGCYACAKDFCIYSRTSYDSICKNGSSLYVVEFKSENEHFIKIGMSKNLKHRLRDFKRTGYEVSLIEEVHSDGATVFDLEKMLHKEFRCSKYSPEINFAGDRECFSIEVLDDCRKILSCII